MPIIPQNTIDRIRDQADIVDIISKEIELKKKGVNYFGVCPFHDENTPSFSVSPSKQIYHCFGCGNGGNVFTFLMEFQKLNFYEAVKSLADKYNITIDIAKKGSNSSQYSFLYELHEKATLLYQNNLVSNFDNKPIEYLIERNLSEDIIKKFRIGFALDSWNNLYNKIRNEGSIDSLMKSGLLIRSEKGIFDRFRSRIMFPIFHQSGKVIAFGGRDFEKNDVAKYLNSPETTLYQKSNTLYGLHITKNDIRKSGYAILVEGYMDLLQLYQAGIHSVVSVSGTSLTRNHANILSKLVNKIILLYDGDSAGANAAIRAGFILYQSGMEPYVVQPPDQLDPDDWLLKRGASEIKLAIESPKSFLDFHIEFHNSTNLKGTDRRDYLHELLFNIKNIKDTIIKNELIKDISEKFKISEIDLLQILNSKKSYNKEKIVEDLTDKIEFTSKIHRAELELTRILIHASTERKKELKKIIDIELFSHELLIKIVSKIVANKSLETSKLVEYFPEKMERELISKLLIDEKKDESIEQIVNDCLKTLKLVPIKKRINELRGIIQNKELSGHSPSTELKEIMALQNQLIEAEE